MRFALDTNVIGEALKAQQDPEIMAWLNGIGESEAALPSPVLAELLFGVQRLDAGKRRDGLMARLRLLIDQMPILAFDAQAAGFFAVIMVERQALGQPMQKVDAMIAAIARAHDLTLVSCDARAFAAGGVAWLNPLSSK